MIPRTKLTNEIFANPLRSRVTACRKRLRDSRGAYRSANSTEPDEPRLAQFPADSPAVRQLVSLDLSPAFGEKQACETAESVEDEVGIT